jgi:hypothetical protein
MCGILHGNNHSWQDSIIQAECRASNTFTSDHLLVCSQNITSASSKVCMNQHKFPEWQGFSVGIKLSTCLQSSFLAEPED